MAIPKNLNLPLELAERITALEKIPMEERIKRALSIPLGIFLDTYKTKKQLSEEIGYKVSSSLRTRSKDLNLGVSANALGIGGFGGTSVYSSPEEQFAVSEFLEYEKPVGRKKKEVKESE